MDDCHVLILCFGELASNLAISNPAKHIYGSTHQEERHIQVACLALNYLIMRHYRRIHPDKKVIEV